MMVSGMFKLQELISIFVFYDIQYSRPVRLLTLFMKLIVMLNISSLALYLTPLALIFITIFLGEFSVAFIKVLKAELAGGFCGKLIGILIVVVILFVSWTMALAEVNGLPLTTADAWALYFLISYLLNTFCIDPILVCV